MEVVWAGPPVTAQQVVSEVGEAEGWKPQTVKTLLARLVKKGALRAEAEANRYLYHPVVSRAEAVAVETDTFLDRISRGSLTPMLVHLAQSRRPLDEAEIEALRKLLPPKKETKKTRKGDTPS